jgi:hypothetical protein
MREQMCEANDNLLHVKQAFYRREATYEDMKEAAVKVLELRIAAERQYMGKVRTKITTRAISSLIR